MYRLVKKASWLLLFVLLLGSNPSLGQQSLYYEEFFSSESGLSGRTILDILQQDNGFIWVATPNGLNRFDGYQFKAFRATPSKSNPFTISSDDISQIDKYKDGRLLIEYQNNVVFFDLFDPYSFSTQKISLLPNSGIKGIVRNIYCSKEGEIYIFSIASEGYYLYHFLGDEGFEVQFFIEETYSSKSQTVNILKLQDSGFLIHDPELGLRIIDDQGNKIRQFGANDFPTTVSDRIQQSTPHIMHEDKSGRLWLSYRNHPGVYLFDQKENRFVYYDKLDPTKEYAFLWEDEIGNLLFGQSREMARFPVIEGLYCLDENEAINNFSHLLGNLNYVLKAYSKDFFKTIFFGLDTGLDIIKNNKTKVQNYLAADLSRASRGPVIRSIVEDDRGKVYFTRETGIWYELYPDSKHIDSLEIIDSQTGLPLEFQCGMTIQGDGDYLWGIGCQNYEEGILVRYNTKTCLADVFTYQHIFETFIITNDGQIWLLAKNLEKGPLGELVQFDPTLGRFQVFHTKEGQNPLVNSHPRFIRKTANGDKLWVGTENGLFFINPDSKEAIQYITSTTPQNNPLPKFIYDIYEEENNTLWIGSRNGLYHFDPNEVKILEHYTKDEGLPDNSVCGIIKDEKANFWISTFNGLAYFQPQGGTFRNFFTSDGFSHDEFNRFAYLKDGQGRYYFGGVNGLNVFEAEDLLVSKETPKVLISRIEKYNSQRDSLYIIEKNLPELEKLVLNPFDTYFQIFFNLPVYYKSRNNQFKIFLDGVSKDWEYLNNVNSLRYNNLSPGTYNLQILGADANGNWGDEALQLQIKVRRVFYKSWWFITLLLLLIATVTYLFFVYQLENRLKVERFRMKLSSDLHDELSGLLSGIAMQTDLLQISTQDSNMKKRLSNMGKVSRKAMSKMSDVIWSVDSRKDRIKDLVTRMREHADDILLPLDIQYKIDLEKLDKTEKLPVHIRQDLYFIYKEAINNIAKHSNAKQVQIFLGNVGPSFKMHIGNDSKTQNGTPSLNGKSHKKGQGLSNMQMRAHRINATLSIDKENGYAIDLQMKRFA